MTKKKGKTIVGTNIIMIQRKWAMNGIQFAALFPYEILPAKLYSYKNGTTPPMEFFVHLHNLTGIDGTVVYSRALELSEIPDEPFTDTNEVNEPKTTYKSGSQHYPNIYEELADLKSKLAELDKRIK